MPAKTSAKHANIRELLISSAALFPKKVAFEEKKNGEYIPYTYSRVANDAERLGRALCARGLRGANIMIIGENGYYWNIAYLATVAFCGTAVPLSRSREIGTVISAARDCDVSAVIYSDNCSAIADALGDTVPTFAFSELDGLIKEKADAETNSPDSDSVAELAYTAETGETPKAVILTHKNICYSISQMSGLVPLGTEDKLYSILPVSHIYERVCGMLYPLSSGASVAYGEGLKHLSTNMRITRPTVLLAAPLILDRIHGKIWANIEKKGIGEKVRRAIALTEAAGPLRTAVRRQIFAEIHDSLGGRLSLIISGGGTANRETVMGLRHFGIRALQGYGMTESASLISANTRELHEYDSAGMPISGGTVDIYNMQSDGIGEIRYRGANVTPGYYKNEELTRRTLRDGWLYTGDMGYFDRRGFLHIVGRKSNVILTARRRSVFPEELEALLEANPFIREAAVIGVENAATRDYDIVAVIYPNGENLRAIYGEDCSHAQIAREIENAIAGVNAQTEAHKRIVRFALRDTAFEKNEAGKLLRSGITGGIETV